MRVDRNNTIALIIDIQEKLLPSINKNESLLSNVNILVQGLDILEIPLIYTQQYTKGLGHTVKELVSEKYISDGKLPYFEKLSFSCYKNNEIITSIKEYSPKTIIVAGIETHICVMQTVRDLLENGYQVIIATNCIGSRKEEDRIYGLSRMEQEGAMLGTYESILFELMESAEYVNFKEISKLIK